MDKNELKKILRKHKLWIKGDLNGERASLYNADLRGADLSSANLRSVNLNGANLSGADLSDADLYNADLRSANLRSVNLSGADLSGADLSDADLRSASLSGVNLSGADLSGADLSDADLRSASLSGANLRSVKLSGADLNDVKYNEKTAFFALCCPEKGDFIGYKKASDYIVELLITGKRSSATTRKCRCSEAKVLSITELDGSEADVTEVCSNHEKDFIYMVGETIRVDNFDDDRWNECSTGIHFFITRDEAANYMG